MKVKNNTETLYEVHMFHSPLACGFLPVFDFIASVGYIPRFLQAELPESSSLQQPTYPPFEYYNDEKMLLPPHCMSWQPNGINLLCTDTLSFKTFLGDNPMACAYMGQR
ncbi:hypothetical protein GQX74_001895 [Glossina fuscipes]|nr:hypothetical protein GQX74_001895 [Glossina fuscipes]